MNRSWLLTLALALVLACFLTKTWALDDSEITALSDFYTANKAALAALSPAWTADATSLCNSTTPWQGITCINNHVTALSLSKITLGGSIPSSIGGLSYLASLGMSECGLTGTLPSSIENITTLTSIDLTGNALSLCSSSPLSFASSSVSCTLSGQTVTICANSSCCGCQAAWTTAASCTTEIATCANCTGSAPPEYPSATCSNGYYIIPSSFTGGLTINGKAAVMGDLTVPAGDMLGFVGFSSFLNVTGSVTLKSYAIVIAATDDDAAYLKAVGSRLFVSVSYMYVANPIRKAGTYTGYNSLVTVHTKRACKKPTATSSSAGTDYNNWTVAISYGSSCNTWWIIVLSLAAPFLVGLVGVTCSLMEQISKHC